MITSLSLAAILATQIPDFGGKEQAEKMKALSFLEGYWEGTAAYYAGDRKVDLVGSEKVEYKAGGTALFVTGYHTMKRGDQVIPMHDAAAMITYDQATQKYMMTAQLANGMRNTFELKVGKNSYRWEIPAELAGQKTEYEMVITPKGEWNEVGYSVVGDKRVKMMEMTLSKKQ